MTVVDAAAPAPSIPPAVRFIGDISAYWRLLIRSAVLLAITLGIYRFWFATDMRRFLWSNTEIAGETLEYTGTATELLIGFLIAIAVLVPLNLMLFVAAISLGPVGQFAGALSFPLLFLLGQFAVFRARRYRLTRTIYRGVRCHQGGSAVRFAICVAFSWTLIVLTLGLAYPFAQSRLERFKMRHTYYGDLQGRFEGSALRLFVRGLPMWLAVIGPLIFALAFSAATVDWSKVGEAATKAGSGTDFISQLESKFPGVTVAIVVAIGALTVSLLMAAILFPVFQAMALRWWISGLRLGSLSIRSRLRTGSIYRAYLRFMGYALAFSVVAGILAGMVVVTAGQVLGAMKLTAAADVVNAIIGIASYVASMLGYSTIYQGTVKFTLWRSGMESIELEGADALDRVKAAGTPSSAVGEGLADALNVGGF